MNGLPADAADGLPDLMPNEARATLVLARGGPGLRTSLWIGGFESATGTVLTLADLSRACVVDCAGGAPAALRAFARLWLPTVFHDLEAVPGSWAGLQQTAHHVAALLRTEPGNVELLLPAEAEAPLSVYVMCQQGLNRSGLLTGMILRELGFSGADALALLRALRPGCLSNLTFRGLVESYECQATGDQR